MTDKKQQSAQEKNLPTALLAFLDADLGTSRRDERAYRFGNLFVKQQATPARPKQGQQPPIRAHRRAKPSCKPDTSKIRELPALPRHESWLTEILTTWQFTD
jgi:hypothetical protein